MEKIKRYAEAMVPRHIPPLVEDEQGPWVLHKDHESALAAQAKEFNERVEALAREWEARIEVHEAQRRSALYSRYEVLDAKVTIFKGCAAELRRALGLEWEEQEYDDSTDEEDRNP